MRNSVKHQDDPLPGLKNEKKRELERKRKSERKKEVEEEEEQRYKYNVDIINSCDWSEVIAVQIFTTNQKHSKMSILFLTLFILGQCKTWACVHAYMANNK